MSVYCCNGLGTSLHAFSFLSFSPSLFHTRILTLSHSSLSLHPQSARLTVPCRECYTYDSGDAVIRGTGINVIGKLVFPANVAADVSTRSVLVQGELVIASDEKVSQLASKIGISLAGDAVSSLTTESGITIPTTGNPFIVAG
eukprot:7057108-Ditylum_brightwellii.AAC.1